MRSFSARRAALARWIRVAGAPCALALALACDTAPGAPDAPFSPPDDARLIGQLGGGAFVANAEALLLRAPGVPDSLYLFAVHRLAPTGGSVYSLRVRIALVGVGTYSLGESEVELDRLVGGDISGGRRVGSPVPPGTLTITSIGAVGEPVSGTLEFWLAPSASWPSRPEPESFTNGVFTVRLRLPPNSAPIR